MIISVIIVAVTVIDKAKAQVGAWRVKENTLFLPSAPGGSVAMYITVRVIRHKTKHAVFMVGIPLIILAQLALIYGLSLLLWDLVK